MTHKLRIRHSGGSATINNAASAKEVGEIIQETTGISLSRQEWKCGYPPRHSIFVATDPLPFDVDSIHVSEGDKPSLRFPVVVVTSAAVAAADEDCSPPPPRRPRAA